MYIDESKRERYLMAGIVIADAHVDQCRRRMRSFLLPDQERIHFKSESDGRRRSILEGISRLPLSAVAAIAPKPMSERAARAMCLEAPARHAQTRGVQLLGLERSESFAQFDRDIARRSFVVGSILQEVSVRLLPAKDEPLLWISDAIAWVHLKDAQWRARAPRVQVL